MSSSATPESRIIFPPETDDGIISFKTLLNEPSYRLAVGLHPAELRYRIERIMYAKQEEIAAFQQDLRELQNNTGDDVEANEETFRARIADIRQQIAELRQTYELFGGDVETKMQDMYTSFNYSDYWFDEKFGERDKEKIKDQLLHLMDVLKMKLGELKVLDIGTGSDGRVVKHLIEVAREISDDSDQLAQFIDNIHAIDVVPEVVENAREALGPLGVRRSQVTRADFRNLPLELRQEGFHLVTNLMHGMWHLLTDREKVNHLQGVDQSLRVRGRYLFDTVPPPPGWSLDQPYSIDGLQPQQFSIYDILYLHYNERMTPVVQGVADQLLGPRSEKVDMLHMGRFIFEDQPHSNSANIALLREAVHEDHIRRLRKPHGIRFQTRLREDVSIPQMSRETQLEMGMAWLKRNQLEEYLKTKLIPRLAGKVSSGVLGDIYAEVAQNIIGSYQNRYVAWRKVADVTDIKG